MTTSSQADAGVFTPARQAHAVRRAVTRTALTAVLAVVFGLSVMVEVSNTPEAPPAIDLPAVAVYAASTPTGDLHGRVLPEGATAAF